MKSIVYGVLVGIAATVTMDMLSSASRRLGLTAGARGQWVGRWYLGIPHGELVHSNIEKARERPGEVRAAQVGHYVIGVVLAIVYVAAAGGLGVSPGSLAAALGYGVATTVFPLLLVYPALGFGALGHRGPPELKPIITSLLNHLFYGFGLWWSAKALAL